MQIKPKQKRNSIQKPQEQEDFERDFCVCELEEINESLIDDLCYATERIEKLENGFIKGLFVGGVIVGIVWLISL